MSSPTLRPPFVRSATIVHVKIRLTPKAARNALDGLVSGAGGQVFLAARVTAAPEQGRANAALIKLLSKAWHLPRTRLSVARGASSRLKTIAIADADADLVQSLNAWLSGLGDEQRG